MLRIGFKWIVGTMIVGVLGWSSSFALLEKRLTCVVNGSEIVVSLDDSFPLCESLLDDIDEALVTVDTRLETIGDYIAADWNVEYREVLYEQFWLKKHELTRFGTQIDQAMVRYEYGVFVRIKPLVLRLVEHDEFFVGQDLLYDGMVASEDLDELVLLLVDYVKRGDV